MAGESYPLGSTNYTVELCNTTAWNWGKNMQIDQWNKLKTQT